MLKSRPDKKHIVTTLVEHEAVRNVCHLLEQVGFEVTWVGVDSNGELDLDSLRNALRPDTAIVSVMWVADPFGGNLYWAEITAPAVGPKGRVTIWEPKQFYDQKTYDNYTAFKARQPNVWMRVSPMEAPDLPGKYDFMLIDRKSVV